MMSMILWFDISDCACFAINTNFYWIFKHRSCIFEVTLPYGLVDIRRNNGRIRHYSMLTTPEM